MPPSAERTLATDPRGKNHPETAEAVAQGPGGPRTAPRQGLGPLLPELRLSPITTSPLGALHLPPRLLHRLERCVYVRTTLVNEDMDSRGVWTASLATE